MTDLGTLGGTFSEGYGINNSGQVVGKAEPVGVDARAFLYSGGRMFDLNALIIAGLGGATLVEARGINDSGQIIAKGCSITGCQAYRLDPIAPPAVTVVPTLSLMSLGAMALLLLASGLLLGVRQFNKQG